MKPRPSQPNHRRRPIGKEDGGDGAARPSPCFPDHRQNTTATVGDGGDGLARRWLVTFPNGEVQRKYQWPVGVGRVLDDPRTRHLIPGIWRRRETYATGSYNDRPATPVFIFVRQADYTKRIDLPKLAREVVEREFSARFAVALESAIRSAR